MKNVIANIQNTKGFVSIESILVIGAVVILAGLILFFFNGKADDLKQGSNTQINAAEKQIQEKGAAGVGGASMTFTEPTSGVGN